LEEGKQAFDNMFKHDPDSPYAGYIFADLFAERRYSPLSRHDSEWNELIPTTLWFNIDSTTPGLSEIDDTKVKDLTRYAAKGINIHNTSLEASTTMCDVVECLDVRDPKDDNNEVRAVPLMCPGEWANDFIINDVTLENVDFIGEPGERVWVRAYMQSRDIPQVTWIIDGKILGGLSPWQSIKNQANNLELVSLRSGNILDTDSEILTYYYRDAESYYLPVNRLTSELGWINQDVSKNTLMFSVVQKSESEKADNAILLLKEGPAWKTSCSRPLIQTTSSPDIYSPPLTGSSIEIFEPYHQMKFLLPGFSNPVSEPVVRTGLYLGDEGAYINGKTLIPVEVKIVPGKERVPIYYVPQEDTYYPYKKFESEVNRLFFRNVDALLIPQSSSLVLVNIKRGAISKLSNCSITNEEVHLSYPGYYPIAAEKRQLLGFTIYYDWICSDRGLDETWLVFRFPSLDFDQSQLVLSIKGEDNWVIWSLDQN